ncbi:MAG TPA: helix-turn-helix transcriptional regulator [Thermoanaerobaculia bacterium]
MLDRRPIRPLGEFECAVLLAVSRLGDGAYGIAIRADLEAHLGRPVSIGSIYTTLERLRAKGMVSARFGDPTPERGGRAKKFFAVEARGTEALDYTRRASEALWGIDPTPETT